MGSYVSGGGKGLKNLIWRRSAVWNTEKTHVFLDCVCVCPLWGKENVNYNGSILE